MRNQAEGGVGWLRRLWRRSAEGPASHPGREATYAVETVLGSVETTICDGVVHREAAAASAARALRLETADAPTLNCFGRPVQEEVASGARAGVTLATGMALAGIRSAAFVDGDELPECHGVLRAAAERLTPLVLHAANSEAGHAGYHAVADSGWMQILASSGQEALDLTLVARWVSERALVPGLVATDGSGIERLSLPDEEMLRSYLGPPRGGIPSPTEAQRILFGNDRSRLLGWFDPDRPVATGGVVDTADAARSEVGRQVFFRDPVAGLARQGMEELSRLTGRPLSFVQCHGLDDARAVLVAQGAVLQAARAVASHLRQTRGWKIGVVGVPWLRPFPAREIAEALEGRNAVAVIEAVDRRLAPAPPLLREIEAVVSTTRGWTSASSARPFPDPERLVSLCELLLRPERPRQLRLDRVEFPQAGDSPRRDALLQSVANAYPELRESALPAAEPPDLIPAEARSAGVIGAESELPPGTLGLLADALDPGAGSCQRGGVVRPRPGLLSARVWTAPSEFPDPGPRAPVSLLLILLSGDQDLGQALEEVEAGGRVILASADPPGRIWSTLPPSWQALAQERGLRLLGAEHGFESGFEVLRGCLDGEESALIQAGRLHEIPCRSLPRSVPEDRSPPWLVRRIEHVRAAHDSLPRFWGEVIQPRQLGHSGDVPDPLATSGAVPAGASGLTARSSPGAIPVVDAEACTGCGRCWTACPDSAIGVTVIGPEALFTAASRIAATEGAEADALRRAHTHLAARLGGQILSSGAGRLREEECRETWAWLSKRLDLDDAEVPAYQAAFDATLEAALRLDPVVTHPFFREPESSEKGAGELLVLAIDPHACLGCGLCVRECPDEALRVEASAPERGSDLEARWRSWEELPDTSGGTLARVAQHPEVGALPALLLSRHCAQAQAGGTGGEPGSGERLAARLVVAAVEQHAQQRLAALVKSMEDHGQRLEKRTRECLAQGLSDTAMETLVEALGQIRRGDGSLAQLGHELDAMGAPAGFDRLQVQQMAQAASRLAAARRQLAEGEDGLGRARFGVVVARGTVAEWAAGFPAHPYHAPLTLAPTAESVELARGISRGLVARYLEVLRSLRRAALEIEAPADRSVRLERIDALTWEDLEPDERSSCPPLLLMGDEIALLGHGFGALTQLLRSDLPVKIVLLDGRSPLESAPEPGIVAMTHRQAFVLGSSVAHPDHLAAGLSDALAFPGPALIHLHAPSPRRHGFAADRTLDRARHAVSARAHLLLRYDPAGAGLFGLNIDLDGNPSPDADWGESTLAEWAAGERRFDGQLRPFDGAGGLPLEEWVSLPASERERKQPICEIRGEIRAVGPRLARAAVERVAVWNTLRELCGASSPFTEKIRAELEQQLQIEHGREIDALKSEHEARVAEMAASAEDRAVVRLTERLMTLAGYPVGPGPREGQT